jgi:SOS-response transcriptional repressor LexA
LKELNYERGKPVLKPHNQAYSVIRATGGLEIFGVVVGQFRTYRQSKAAKW